MNKGNQALFLWKKMVVTYINYAKIQKSKDFT